MNEKEINVVFYGRRFVRQDWRYDIDPAGMIDFFQSLSEELKPFGVRVNRCDDDAFTLDIKGYGDLLNSVRIRSPKDSISNLCLGHIIGASPNRNLQEDIRRGVNRVAFAPETIEPEGSDKVVCHNCGCGC